MSLTAVKPYFKLHCEAVGLRQHDDAFNSANVASSIIDKSYFLQVTNFNGRKLNQNDQEVEFPMTVVLFFKGYRSPSQAIDMALEKVEALIKEVQKPAYRLGTSLKNVSLTAVDIEPIDGTNDNAVKVSVNFNVILTIEL